VIHTSFGQCLIDSVSLSKTFQFLVHFV